MTEKQNLNQEKQFPPLQDFLCFAVYTANLAFGKAYKPYFNQLGLTYTQWIVLLALSEGENQTVNQLGQKVFLASNTLTPLLKGLEQQGLILRQRSKTDERQVVLNLTEQGQQKCQQSLICMNIIEKFGLSLEEIKVLQKAMCKLRDSLLQ
ncbi:MarR family winged helix-turn-helix transcriptional regulator [Volucribacter amazonae]|uniref:MarR family transcriptional regulator n=1 Tax=Volucribacter amazonae TaxID=256731 RepID=A0A9X4SKY6_9PAST|nr:MarR family transcriptional regulator [Volucribacter amazonae]MDG6895589.1 MarR family transcriptional regulator [Volucribacter amazonae]